MRRPLLTLSLVFCSFALAPAPSVQAQAAKPKPGKKAKLDLQKIGRDLESRDEARMLGALNAIAEAHSIEAAPLVDAVLARGATVRITVRALEVSGELGQPSSTDAALPYVRHRVQAVRHAAAHCVSRTGGPRAVRALERALRSRDARMRGIAALGLGELGSKPSVPKLERALDHGVLEAAEAIARLCEPEQCRALRQRVATLPFQAQASAFTALLFRPSTELPDSDKVAVVEQIEALDTAEAAEYLRLLQERWPKQGSAKVKRAIDAAVAKTRGE